METKKLVPSSTEVFEATKHQGRLSVAERNELAHCEEQMAFSMAQAALALKTIRDKRLYRAEFTTWEGYVRVRWDYSKSYSHQLIDFAATYEIIEAAKKFASGRLLLPTSERQVRPLAKLCDDEKIIAAWLEAVKRSDGKSPTSARVEAVVAEMMGTDRKSCAMEADAAQALEITASAGADEAEQQEDAPDADASLNVSDDAISDASDDVPQQDAQSDVQTEVAESAAVRDVVSESEPADDAHASPSMQEQGADDDEGEVGKATKGCVGEAEVSGEVDKTPTTNDEPAEPQVSPAPPRRQATPEKVERANKLARICRDAVADQVSEAEAALIFELLRTRLAE